MAQTWVVYRRPMRDDSVGVVGICTSAEWTDLNRVNPGHLTLIRAGITAETEAEQVARQAAGHRRTGKAK